MDWTEIKISVPTSDTEKASDIAVMAVPYGIYTEDYSTLESEAMEIAHIDLIDEALLLRDRTHSIIHLYIAPGENPAEAVSFLTERLSSADISYTIDTGSCRQEDWANEWKKYFKPTPVGERLFIRPVWEDEFDSRGRAVLNLEPGAAFGTGTHDTTRLCLTALDRIIKDTDTVLDIGTGSGILAIASCLLGAKTALGVDIDPVAVRTAKENGEMNSLSEPRLTFKAGDLTEQVTGRYSVIVANIVADVIKRLAPEIRTFAEKDALFIASGIIDTRGDEVLSSLENEGLTLLERFESGGWVCLLMKI